MSEDRKEEQETQERQEAAAEEDTRPLDAQDWEENRGAEEQEERPQEQVAQAKGTGEMTHERGSQAEADEYQWHEGRTREHGSDDAVEFIDVVKAFGRNRVLNGLNLGLPDNQISMILGPSGTGKSVCIKHMVGLLYPDEGDVIVHGESVPDMADEDLFEMRKKFGVLFQDGALFGSMNVFDNTAFPLRQHTDKGEDEIREIVDRRLSEVGLAAAPTRCRTSSPAACASAPASLARSCSTRTSCSSTSQIPGSTRCARRSCASSSWRCTRRTAARIA